MAENDKSTQIKKYAYAGFLFGMLFPFMAITIDLIHKNVALSISGVVHLHSINPLHFIIDSAPLVLSYVAYLIGNRVINKEYKNRKVIEDELLVRDHAAEFAIKLSNQEYDIDCSTLEQGNELCKSLISLRDSLVDNKKINDVRLEEEKKQSWINKGLAKFSDVLRKDDDINNLSYNVISNLVKYMDAIQGGLFIYNDDEKDSITLDLLSAFAYDRRKFLNKSIKLGEGLIGTCGIEKETIHLTNVPDHYIEITSGLGDASPKSILITPLKIEGDLLGVVEIASFKEFQDHEIEFVEKIGETIASTFLNTRNNNKTADLLKQSHEQTEKLNEQEEEMRQSIEELQSTQEEMERNENQLTQTLDAINNAIAVLEYDFDGHIINANSIYCKLFGYTLEELKGQHHSVVFDNKNIQQSEAYLQFWDDLRADISSEGVMKRLSKSGEAVMIRGISKPILDINKQPVKVMEMSFDISDSVKQEEELRVAHKQMQKKENQLSQTIEAIDSVIAVLEYDFDGIIISVNQIYCDLMEYTSDELIGEHHSIVFDNHNIHQSPGYKEFWNSLRKGKSSDRVMKRISKTGRSIILRGVSKPIFKVNNEPKKVMEMSFDISDS